MQTWLSIGDDARGAALYERAVAARREAAGPGRPTPELALALAAWGNALWNADRQARALEVIDEAIATCPTDCIQWVSQNELEELEEDQ